MEEENNAKAIYPHGLYYIHLCSCLVQERHLTSFTEEEEQLIGAKVVLVNGVDLAPVGITLGSQDITSSRQLSAC